MELKRICKKYFEVFSNKDLKGLRKLFSKDITLRDWEISEEGISSVLAANKKIFSSVQNIKVKPLKLYEVGNTIIAEIEISINNRKEILLVVDIIDFNNNNKIETIRAYKG